MTGDSSSQPGGPLFERVFLSDPSEVRAAVMSGHDALLAARVSPEQVTQIELALAEALNNVAEHAYLDRPDGWISLCICLSNGMVEMTIRDRGKPLPEDGVPHRDPNPEGLERDDLPEGGFGWFLIRALAHELRHARREGMNVLSMRFDLAQLA